MKPNTGLYIKHNRRVYLFSGGGDYLNME